MTVPNYYHQYCKNGSNTCFFFFFTNPAINQNAWQLKHVKSSVSVFPNLVVFGPKSDSFGTIWRNNILRSSSNSCSCVTLLHLTFSYSALAWLYCPNTSEKYFFLGCSFKAWHLKHVLRQIPPCCFSIFSDHRRALSDSASSPFSALFTLLNHLRLRKQPWHLMRSPCGFEPAIIFILSWKMRVMFPCSFWPTSTFVVPAFLKMRGWIFFLSLFCSSNKSNWK